MKNFEVAQIFRDIALILEIQEENPFRIRAYERVAQNLERMAEDIEKIAKEKKLQSLPGVGKDLAGKIEEILSTERLKYYKAQPI